MDKANQAQSSTQQNQKATNAEPDAAEAKAAEEVAATKKKAALAKKEAAAASKAEAMALCGIAIEIECTSETREREAEAAFMERMDGSGGVLLENKACGGSIYFDCLEKFPKVNRRCTCGNHKHFMVKFKFI